MKEMFEYRFQLPGLTGPTGPTVREVLDEYLRSHVAGLATARAREQRLRLVLEPLMTTPVSAIRQRDLVDALSRWSGVSYNRQRAHLQHFLRWCRERELTSLRPELSRVRETARSHVLPVADIRRLYEAAGELGPWRGFCRLLILTAQRRSEVWRIKSSEISEDFCGAWWTRPASKRGRPHRVWLPPAALAELHLGEKSPRSFPWSAKSDFSGLRDRWGAAISDPDWTLHDLRRSAATHMVEAGVRPEVVDLVLAHTIRGVGGVYMRHELLDERRAAAELWARMVTG